MEIAWLLEDLRGIPNPTGSKQAPAVVGACPLCEQRGSRLPTTSKKDSTYYPGAICHCTGEKHKDLRDEFEKEFNKIQSVLFNTNRKPANMTTAKAHAAAVAVQNQQTETKKEAEAKNQPFKQFSAFHDFFPDSWDMVKKRLVVDGAHQFSNLGLDILALINNKDKMKWTDHRKDSHRKFGRFQVHGYITRLMIDRYPMMCTYKSFMPYFCVLCYRRPPWTASSKVKKLLNKLLKHPHLNDMKCPIGWPDLTRVFSKDYEHLKISEVLAFLGDRGR